MELPYVRLVVAASVALLMARSGLKKKSLSKDGAAAAVTVLGFISSTHATTAAAPTLAPGSDTSASLQPRGRFFFFAHLRRSAPPRHAAAAADPYRRWSCVAVGASYRFGATLLLL